MRTTPHGHCLALALIVTASACAVARARSSSPDVAPCLIDLSYAFDDDTIYWPTAPSRFHKETLSYGLTHGGYFYSAFAIATPEHGGTHIDAPIHFAEGQATTEAIPLERLMAPGVVIDMTGAAANDRDALLTVEHIDTFERQHGTIEVGTIVLIRTGWAKYWPDVKRYLGDDTPGDATSLHFPGISEPAARALVAREVAAVRIDTASIDHGPSKDFIAHRVLLEAGIPAFENVAKLSEVPARDADIIALPMKIAGGSGGPLRIVAVVPAARCGSR
ncbi:MAG: cyclase family protein [Deltaproteobacteria bacterium]|nr:cyclase family protein [Deltaproteobacteria bacterium]